MPALGLCVTPGQRFERIRCGCVPLAGRNSHCSEAYMQESNPAGACFHGPAPAAVVKDLSAGPALVAVGRSSLNRRALESCSL